MCWQEWGQCYLVAASNACTGRGTVTSGSALSTKRGKAREDLHRLLPLVSGLCGILCTWGIQSLAFPLAMGLSTCVSHWRHTDMNPYGILYSLLLEPQTPEGNILLEIPLAMAGEQSD